MEVRLADSIKTLVISAPLLQTGCKSMDYLEFFVIKFYSSRV